MRKLLVELVLMALALFPYTLDRVLDISLSALDHSNCSRGCNCSDIESKDNDNFYMNYTFLWM